VRGFLLYDLEALEAPAAAGRLGVGEDKPSWNDLRRCAGRATVPTAYQCFVKIAPGLYVSSRTTASGLSALLSTGRLLSSLTGWPVGPPVRPIRAVAPGVL